MHNLLYLLRRLTGGLVLFSIITSLHAQTSNINLRLMSANLNGNNHGEFATMTDNLNGMAAGLGELSRQVREACSASAARPPRCWRR